MRPYNLIRVRELWEDHPPVLELIDTLETLGNDMPWTIEIPIGHGHTRTLGSMPYYRGLWGLLPERLQKRFFGWVEGVWNLSGWTSPLEYLLVVGAVDLAADQSNYVSKTKQEMDKVFVQNCGVKARELRSDPALAKYFAADTV